MAVEPFPFASVDELKARWPDFPPGGDTHAEVMLEDASQFILDTCPSAADAQPATRRRIVCSVVRRAMQADDGGLVGMETMQIGTGPFQMSGKATNPHGDFYLTRLEKKALGDGVQKAFGVAIGGAVVGNHLPWCSLAFGAKYCSCGADIAGRPIYEGGAP